MRAFPRGARPNIEEVLSFVDHAIAQREPVMDFKIENLREVRAAVVNVITEILMSVQERLNHVFGVEDIYNPYCALNSPDRNREGTFKNKLVAEAVEEASRVMEIEVSAETKKATSSKMAKGWGDTYIVLAGILNDGDTVITLNYDLFLDIAIAAMYSKYGRMDEGAPFRVTYGTDYLNISSDGDYYSKGPLHAPPNDEPPLKHPQATILKLHGSLNWAFCSSCKTLLMTEWTPISRISTHLNSLQSLDTDFKSKHLCCSHFTLESLIVPPTWMKDYDNPVLRTLWQKAVAQLQFADEIVFLGYSFSEVDFQFRYLFSRALHMRHGKPWRRITVVNSDESVFWKYRRFFGEVDCVEEKASEFLRTIPFSIRTRRN